MINKESDCSIQSEFLVTSSCHLYAGSVVFLPLLMMKLKINDVSKEKHRFFLSFSLPDLATQDFYFSVTTECNIAWIRKAGN